MDYVAVNFDRLVSEVSDTVRRLCGVVRYFFLAFFEGKPEFWRKTHHHLHGAFSVRQQLHASNPGIRQTTYTREFESLVPEIEDRIRRWEWLSRTIACLHENDVENLDAYPRPAVVRDIKRNWNAYYKSKINRYLKRFRPEYHPDKVATLTMRRLAADE